MFFCDQLKTICLPIIQCWYNLSGQYEENLKFKTGFSQIELVLDKRRLRPILLKIITELIWCNLFCKTRAQNLSQKRSFLALFSQLKITSKVFVHLLTKLYHYKPFMYLLYKTPALLNKSIKKIAPFFGDYTIFNLLKGL